MNFKEKLEEYVQVEKKLENKNLELKKIDKRIAKKKSELESLKWEISKLGNLFNNEFKEKFKEYDYEVDITDCYIIGLNGKKYITLKTHNTNKSGKYNLITGNYNIEIYRYYDILDVKDNKFKYLHEYKYGHFDNRGYFAPTIIGNKPDYEKHILDIYPELIFLEDNKVPNTYLEKIYCEINSLNDKQLIKNNF